MTVWFGTAYVDSLIRASESANGITLNYDSFSSQTIIPESATVNYCFPNGLPNLNSTVMGCQKRERDSMSHFNYTCNAIKSFCFRVG